MALHKRILDLVIGQLRVVLCLVLLQATIYTGGSFDVSKMFICPGRQITWIDGLGKIIRCSPCPPCFPGQEYSIPCFTKARNGTPANCIDCPKGKYSDGFDIKPCVACTRCSKRHVEKNCTKFKNAKCGGCLAGYYHDKVISGCIECARCCGDSKDQAPPGCSRVGMCKPRPLGCPSTSRTSTALPKTHTLKAWNTSQLPGRVKFTPRSKALRTRKLRLLTTRQNTSSTTSTVSTLGPSHLTKPRNATSAVTPQHNKRKANQTDGNTTDDQILIFQALFGTFGFITVAVLIILGIVFYKHYVKREIPREKPRQTAAFYRSSSYDFLPETSPGDMSLADFIQNKLEPVEKACRLLYDKLKNGMYDYERIAYRFGLTADERLAINNAAKFPHENPTRELFLALSMKRPKITVKQVAEVAKKIKRNDVYEILQPFFTVPSRSSSRLQTSALT